MASHQTPLLATLEHHRAQLIDEVRSGKEISAAQDSSGTIGFPDVYLASGCLQKALRRGQFDHAQAAGRYLLAHDADRLWRRLCVCAFEDFGTADLALTAMVTVAAASKALRLVLGEKAVLDHLIVRLCAAVKDRRLDDLYALAAAGIAQRGRPLPDGPLGALVHQAQRLVMRLERKVPRRAFRVVVPAAVTQMLDAYQADGRIGRNLAALCDLGTRVSHCLLPALFPFALQSAQNLGAHATVTEPSIPLTPLIAGVPAYALDGFTRIGRQVLAELARSHGPLRDVTRALGVSDRLDVLHHLLFFAEGARSRPLLRDDLSRALEREARAVGARMPAEAALAAVDIMAGLLPLEDMRRRALLAAYPHWAAEEDRQ
jgi:hypothetical protein